MTEPVIRAQYRCSLGLSSPKSCSKGFCGATDCASSFVPSNNADLLIRGDASRSDHLARARRAGLLRSLLLSVLVVFFRQTPEVFDAAKPLKHFLVLLGDRRPFSQAESLDHVAMGAVQDD